MHQRWNFSEIQTSNQDIVLMRPKSAFSSMLDPTVTLNFDLLTPKIDGSYLFQNAPMQKVSWKYIQ